MVVRKFAAMSKKPRISRLRLVVHNQITFPVDLHITQLRSIQARIRSLCDVDGFDQIFLDFVNSKTGFAEYMVPFCCSVLSYQYKEVSFFLRLPNFDRLRRLFVNCGWAHLIAPWQFPDKGLYVGDNMPLTQFRTQAEQHALVNSCVDRVLRKAHRLERSDLQAIEWSINETCDNVLNHSDSLGGGLFQMNFRNLNREVEFIVADAGIGIPNSLRSIRNKDWSDQFALEQCIKQGVTRDPEFGQGNGLFGTYQMAAMSGGTFHINSGNAHLVATREGKVAVRNDPLPFDGSLVVCAIRFTQSGLLERALAFKGKDYKMVDFVENTHETEDGSVTFDMSVEAESFGSRRAGFDVRRKLNNLLLMSGVSTIICDMTGVSLMSSSFADEVFGKMAREFGANIFQRRLRLKGLSTTNSMLVGRAVSQRMSEVVGASSES